MPRRNLLVAAGAAAAVLVVVVVIAVGRSGDTGSTASFCSALRSGDDPLTVFDRYDPADPAAARATLEQGRDRLRQLQRAAPSELHTSMGTLVRVADELVKVVAGSAPSGGKTSATPATTHDFRADFAAVEQASATVVTFALLQCGIGLGAATSAPATIPPGTPAN